MRTSQLPYIVGVDIGGANLKLADTDGRSTSCSFPLWLQPELLGERLGELLRQFPAPDELAITMTGELADCFATRREGVSRILDQVGQAFSPEQTFVYAVGDRWLSPHEARLAPWSVAASNWYALATWLGMCSLSPECGFSSPDPGRVNEPAQPLVLPRSAFLLLDIGSTTTDIIPVNFNQAGKLAPETAARTDRDRLERQQLVYTGMQRTPVSAIVRDVELQGTRVPLMAERFATSDDSYLMLGLVFEDAADCDTADGRPRTIASAHARLARMIGEDAETLSIADAKRIAEQIIDAQAQQIASALITNLNQFGGNSARQNVIIGGHGRPLAIRAFAKLIDGPVTMWLDDLLSTGISRVAPAVAVAALRVTSARQQLTHTSLNKA